MGHNEQHSHDHLHDHEHGHARGEAGSDHHGHAHDPAAVLAPGPSLLRMSALARLLGAALLSGLIRFGVKWAVS